MPKTIKTEVYTYQELLELAEKHKGSDEGKKWSKAVDNAAQWLRDVVVDHEWWDSTYEMWQSALDEIGFENAQISFSGFWSQGDGASFTSDVNLRKLIAFLSTPPAPKDHVEFDGKKETFGPYIVHKLNNRFSRNPRLAKLLKIANSESQYWSAAVKRTSHHYSHQNTCDFQFLDEPNIGTRHKLIGGLMTELEKYAEELRYSLSTLIYDALEEDHEAQTSDESIEDFAQANEYTFDDTGSRFG